MEREIPTTARPEIAISCVAFRDGGSKLLLNWCSANLKRFGLNEWDLATGKPIRSWPYSGPSDFPSGGCIPMYVGSADGRHCLVSWCGNPWSERRDDRGPVSLLEFESGVERPLAGAMVGYWNSASFSGDGRLLAVPGLPTTTIWDLQTFQPVGTVRGAGGATFSPDGRRLALGDGSVWDTGGWDQVLKLEMPSGVIFDTAFSPDGNVFAAHTQFGALHLWRAPSWAEIEAAEKAGPD